MVAKIKFNANSKILPCKFKINNLLLKKGYPLSTFSSKVQKGTKLDYIISQMHLHSKDLLGIKSSKEDLEKNHGGYLYLHWERMSRLYHRLKFHKVKIPRSFYLPINPNDIINHPTGLYVPGMSIPDSIYFNYGTKKVVTNFWLKVSPFIFFSQSDLWTIHKELRHYRNDREIYLWNLTEFSNKMTYNNVNTFNISGISDFNACTYWLKDEPLTPDFKAKVDIVISTNIDLKPRAVEAYNYYLEEEFFFDRFYE